MEKVLVTGGSGYIGSVLSSYLLDKILEDCSPVNIDISCSSDGPPNITAIDSVIF